MSIEEEWDGERFEVSATFKKWAVRCGRFQDSGFSNLILDPLRLLKWRQGLGGALLKIYYLFRSGMYARCDAVFSSGEASCFGLVLRTR